MNTKQSIILHEAQGANGETLPIEISILCGKETLLIPMTLSRESINRLHQIYKDSNIIYPTWKMIFESVKDVKFEPLTDEIPEPDESEGTLYDLQLANADTVKCLVRVKRHEIDARSLILV